MRRKPTPADRSLQAFLRGDASTREALPVALEEDLLRIAKGLSLLHAREIVQQMWLLLARRPQTFDPRRAGMRTYLKQMLRSAARDVVASYAEFGEKTRQRGSEELRFRHISLDDASTTTRPEAEYVADASVDVETEAIGRADALDMIRLADSTAPPEVREALRLVYFSGLRFGEAAAAVGVHRSVLRRRIDGWVARYLRVAA